jgi:hypothetical protein
MGLAGMSCESQLTRASIFATESIMNKTIQLFRVLSLIAILLAMPSGPALAALRSCRTDPIFKLSNGDILTVTLEIGTDAYNISNIHYILHVPAGVTVTQVTYTAGPINAMKETFVVRQDSPAKTYTIDTYVTTQTQTKVQVIVYTRLNSGIRKTVTGYNFQHLFSTLSRP